MSTITITRSSGYINRLRNYRVIVDDQKLGTVSNGDSVTLPVAPGTHTLKMTIDWCASPTLTFNVAPGETQHFYVSSFKNSRVIFPGIIAAMLLSRAADYFLKTEISIWVAVATLAGMLYLFTFGRKQYLCLVADHQ